MKRTFIYLFLFSLLVGVCSSCSKSSDEDGSGSDVGTTENDVGTTGNPVDLGLSVKWADHNVGASVSEGFGGLYGWADPTGNKTTEAENEYPSSTPPSDISGTEYDIARVRWGGTWRMPTSTEFTELYQRCSHTWITVNNIYGMKFTASNGNSIFLPAAGDRWGTASDRGVDDEKCGYYWTSNPGILLIFNQSHRNSDLSLSKIERSSGLSVRPVCN